MVQNLEWILFEGLSRSKKVGWVPSGDRSVAAEQVQISFSTDTLHLVKLALKPGIWAISLRPIGCISPHSETSVVTGISLFPNRRHQIQIASATVRPEFGTMAVYGSSQTGKIVGFKERACHYFHTWTIGSTYIETGMASTSRRKG